MEYYYSRKLKGDFDKIIEKIKEKLNEEGFGVLTNIDVKAVLKKKLGVDFPKYMILGACNPNFSYKALQVENKVGTMLPCNIIVQEENDEKKQSFIEVSAVNPVASMQSIGNKELEKVADEIGQKLRKVVDSL